MRGVVQRIVGGCEASPRQAMSGTVRVDGANALTELHRLWGVAYTYMYTLILPYRYSPIPSLPHTLPYCHSPILPFSHTVILPYCHSSILSFFHTVIPPYFHSSILSFSHTAIHVPCCLFHSGCAHSSSSAGASSDEPSSPLPQSSSAVREDVREGVRRGEGVSRGEGERGRVREGE